MTLKFRSLALLAALLTVAPVGGAAPPRRPDPARLATGPHQTVAQPSSLPINGGFEDLDGAVPRGWKTATFQRPAPRFSVDTETHRGGARSVRIEAEGSDAAWTTVVKVRPYASYRLTGWIKTDAVSGTGKGALLNIHGIDKLQTPSVTGTRDWTAVELVFQSEGNDAIQVNCLLGGWGKAKGTAWFDDVSLELLAARELKPAVSIDAGRPRAAMSKYIYGQFIEHLGRCIYGGIWAEMLEDRKFYYGVGDKESPWSVSGQPAAVTMSKDAPFVGDHTPEVSLAGNGTAAGIEQRDLALVKGKTYKGRVVLLGEASAAPVTVSLVWGAGETERQTVTIPRLDGTYRASPLAFAAPVSTDHATLVIASAGTGTFRVGTASLMPSDNVEGFRADTLGLLRELNAPVYRWPGGNFVSGYNWRDGIGDRDKRPPRKNPAWKGVEHNDVGLHEFMAFCRLVQAEPYIAVNSGLGDATSAADEVEYVNGAASTPMGKLRAANGHAEPWQCRFWSVGNEMYGDWQLGHMPLREYVQKHNQFAAAMKARSGGLQLVGVGAIGEWSEAMLANCSDNMSLISEHFYSQEQPGLLSHVSQIPREIRQIAEAHRKYRATIPALRGKDIRVALDEWNYWYGPHLYGELGTQYFLKDALGIAAGIHEYSRQSDIVFMANYAQTVNVIGAIKTNKTTAVLDTTGQVLKMYRQHFGTEPVTLTGAPEPLDVAAAWADGRKALTIAIVNPTAVPQAVDLKVAGIRVPASARLWRIAGTNERACNVPGKPPEVEIQETPAAPFGARVTVPPMSASIYELK